MFLRISKRGQITSMSLQELTAPPVVRKGALGTMLTLSSGENDDIILKGASNFDAKAFSDGVKNAWISFNLAAFEKEAGRFERIHAAVAALPRPTRYPAACSMTPLLIDAGSLDATLLSKLQSRAIGPDKTQLVAQVRKFVADPATARTAAISTFVAAELLRWKDFFDTVESKPLTAEQRLSVVVDEDATLVLAGAGSGKTSVITAKAAYLVKAGIRQPEEILRLAFTKNAAAEMSERVMYVAMTRARHTQTILSDLRGQSEDAANGRCCRQVEATALKSGSHRVHNCAHFESRQTAMACGIILPQRNPAAP